MTMTMDPWKDKRTEWTKARDAAKVKKGAVLTVSIGDRLDKLYKSSLKGYRPLLVAIHATQKDVKTYQTKGGKAVAPLSSWFKTLSTDLQKLEAAAKSDANKLNMLDPYLTKFHQLCVPGIPDAGKTRNAMEEIRLAAEKNVTMSWLDGAKLVRMYDELPDVMKEWVKVIKTFKTWKFELKLPGMDAHYAEMADLGKAYEKCYQHLVSYSQVKTYDDHMRLMKPSHQDMHEMEIKSDAFELRIAKLLG